MCLPGDARLKWWEERKLYIQTPAGEGSSSSSSSSAETKSEADVLKKHSALILKVKGMCVSHSLSVCVSVSHSLF